MHNLWNRLKPKNEKLNSLNWFFHKWQYSMDQNIDNHQVCGHVWNRLDNLKAQLIQFTEQQKTAKQVSKKWY